MYYGIERVKAIVFNLTIFLKLDSLIAFLPFVVFFYNLFVYMKYFVNMGLLYAFAN